LLAEEITKANFQYLVDEKGNKVAVLLDAISRSLSHLTIPLQPDRKNLNTIVRNNCAHSRLWVYWVGRKQLQNSAAVLRAPTIVSQNLTFEIQHNRTKREPPPRN
jgi:hypothetical protein